MHACLESTPLPLLESTPTWTIRIARPPADRNELAQILRGVPKAALRQVFGKALGTRLWQQHRAANSTTAKPAAAAPISPSALVPDNEISGGMLRYLCAEAAATLRDRKRFAKSIALTVQYSNGESETVQQALLHAANESSALEAAARLALRATRSNTFVSLKLDVTATTTPYTAAHPSIPAEARVPLTCVA
jgi:hypothetical protein